MRSGKPCKMNVREGKIMSVGSMCMDIWLSCGDRHAENVCMYVYVEEREQCEVTGRLHEVARGALMYEGNSV